MKINWKVRVKSKIFWVSLISALLLFVQSCLAVFGIELKVDVLGESLTVVVNSLFTVLAVLGVVTDPTTEGLSDSQRALSYDQPARDSEGDF
jgi:phi LC3 family holin